MEQHVEHLLDVYYDNELNVRQRLQVEAHLEQCASCRAALARMEQLSRLMADYVPVTQTPPETFRAQVMLRLARRSRQPRGNWVWYAVPAGLGSLLVLLQAVGGMLVLLLTVIGWGGPEIVTSLMPFWMKWPAEYGVWADRVLLWGWRLFSLSVYFSLCIVIFFLFIPYASWISLLWRSTRSKRTD